MLPLLLRNGGLDHERNGLHPWTIGVGCGIVLCGLRVDNKRGEDVVDLIFQHLINVSVHNLHREACFGHDHVQGFLNGLIVGLFRNHHIKSYFFEEGAPIRELLVEDH